MRAHDEDMADHVYIVNVWT